MIWRDGIYSGTTPAPKGHHHPDVLHVAGPTAPSQVRNRETTGCCYGEAIRGPEHCTCWEMIFDVEQQPPRLTDEDTIRTKACHDCAYRDGSPERAAGEGDDLLALAQRPDAGIFYCHIGMRRAVGWRHSETGEELPWAEDRDHYEPGYDTHGRPLRADGREALICASWAAHRRAACSSSQRSNDAASAELHGKAD